jgi:hypothetical protein
MSKVTLSIPFLEAKEVHPLHKTKRQNTDSFLKPAYVSTNTFFTFGLPLFLNFRRLHKGRFACRAIVETLAPRYIIGSLFFTSDRSFLIVFEGK